MRSGRTIVQGLVCCMEVLSEWSVGNGQWVLVSGQWSVGNGQWVMVSAYWSVGNGQWVMVSGYWSVGNGQWVMVSGQWSVGVLQKLLPSTCREGRKEGNVLFNDALNTFYLWLYDIRHMVKDHLYSENE